MAIDWAALGSAAKSAAASSAKQAAAQMGTAAIASGGGFLSQLFFGHKNWKRTKELNRQTYQYNKNLAELAFKQNVQMWNAENAYNTPAAQMMRMRAAGMNPNLIYGNGQEASAGLAGDAPELQYGQYDPKINYFDPTGAAFEGLNYAASLKQINSLVDLQASQAQLNQSEKTLKELEAALKDKDYYWYDTVVASNLSEQNARTNNFKYQSGYYKAYSDVARETARKIGFEADELEIELKYFDDMCQRSLEISAATVKEIEERTKNYPVQRAEMYGKISEMAANVRLMGELGYKYHAEGDVATQQKYNVAQEFRNLVTSNRKLEKEIEALGVKMGLDKEQTSYMKAAIFKTYVNAGTDIVDSAVDAGSAIATGGLSPRTHIKGFGR